MATNDAESKPSGVELPKDDATNEQNVASIRPLDLNDVLLFFQSSISRTLCRLSTPFKLSKQLLSLFVSPILRYLVDFILLLFGLWLCLYILRLVLFSVLGVLATSLFRFFAANLFGTLKEWGVPLWGVSSNLVRYAAKSFTGSNFLEIGAATPFMGAITCKAIGLWCESESANGTLTFREEVEAAYDGMKITHELIWTMNTLSHSPKDLVLYSVVFDTMGHSIAHLSDLENRDQIGDMMVEIGRLTNNVAGEFASLQVELENVVGRILRGYESVNRALESARNDPKLLAHAHDWHNKLIQDVGESLAQLQDSLDTLQDEITKIIEKASGTKSDVMKARRRKDDEFAQFKDGASILSFLFPNIETAGTRKGDKMVRDLNNADGAVKHLESLYVAVSSARVLLRRLGTQLTGAEEANHRSSYGMYSEDEIYYSLQELISLGRQGLKG